MMAIKALPITFEEDPWLHFPVGAEVVLFDLNCLLFQLVSILPWGFPCLAGRGCILRHRGKEGWVPRVNHSPSPAPCMGLHLAA